MAVIFSITTSSITLSKSIVDVQATSRHQAAFHNYLDQLFSNLPSDARVTLEENDQDLPSLRIEFPNTEFPAQGRQHLAKDLWLNAGTDRNGLTNLTLEASNQIEDESSQFDPVFFETELVNSLASFRWEFFNKSRDEWSPEWTPAMGRPSQIKLFYSYPGHSEEHMLYYWIPVRQQPKVNVNARTP